MNSKIKDYLNWILVLIFLCHGMLYFLFPDHLYDEGSWIKLIKFFVLGLFFVLNAFSISKKRILNYFLFSFGISLLLLGSHNPSDLMTMEGAKRLLLYISPLSMILFAPVIDKGWMRNVPIFTVVIGILSAFLEFFVFKGIFTRFNFSETAGFVRVVSIFVNPNNAGLIFSLGFIYIYDVLIPKNLIQYLKKAILLFLLVFVIFLTGSKTPLVILSLYLLLKMIIPSKLKELNENSTFNSKGYSLFFGLIIGSALLLSNLDLLDSSFLSSGRTFSFDTAYIRQTQWMDFFNFNYFDSFLSPNYYELSKTYDIMYLQIWSDLGFIGFLVSLIIFSFLYYYRIRKYNLSAKITYFLLIISGFSLSFLIIWPTAYIFWYLVFSDKFYKYERV